jgi:hypothetical protein
MSNTIKREPVLIKTIVPILAEQSILPNCIWYASHDICGKDCPEYDLSCEETRVMQ